MPGRFGWRFTAWTTPVRQSAGTFWKGCAAECAGFDRRRGSVRLRPDPQRLGDAAKGEHRLGDGPDLAAEVVVAQAARQGVLDPDQRPRLVEIAAGPEGLDRGRQHPRVAVMADIVEGE